MTRPDEPTPSTERWRLFITLPLPEVIRAEVEAISQRLQKGFAFTGSQPKWIKGDMLHQTLVFLGNKPADQVPGIQKQIDRVARRFGPQRLEVKRLGVFPHWHRPRVLWTGIRDRTHQLTELHAALEQAMAPFDYEPENRPYHPHITLARLKSMKGIRGAKKIVEEHANFRFGPFESTELLLYRSRLHPDGAIHTVLSRHPLTGAPATPSPSKAEKEDRDG